MAIIPMEIQEKLENQEEQIRMLNLKLKKCIQDKEQVEGKLKSNRFGFWFFFLSLLGVCTYYFIFLKDKDLSKNDIEKLKSEKELLTVENSTLSSSLKECESRKNTSRNNNLDNYDGVIFRVQLGAFKKFRVRPYSERISSLLDEYSIDLYKKYSIGIFDNKNEAEKLRRDLRKLGFRDCFITYEYKGNRISYKEAMRINKRK